MARLSQVEIIDGFGQSSESYGLAIGAANDALGTKMATRMNRGVVSSSSSLSCETNADGSKTYTAYVTLVVTSYDLPDWLTDAIVGTQAKFVSI